MPASRKLTFEKLEDRQLMSADTWPRGIGLKADLFIDGGAHLSQVSLRPAATLAGLTREVLHTSNHATTRNVIGGNPADLNGALLFPDGQPRVAAIFVNGGTARYHTDALGPTGRKAIADFHAAGGSYTGSCAGEFVATRQIKSLYGGREANPGNRGSQTVEFSETDHPLVRYLMEWNNGSNVVAGIPHIGGPRNSSTYQHPDNTDFLGTITSGVHRGFDFLIEHHKDAESGLTILSPSHPEYGRRPSHTALMAAILRRAVEQAHVDPDIKATLTANQTVTMSGPAEKIGDGQYHRYRLEVPAGLGTLQIALAGLTGNVDLFVQRNGPAHAGSYLAKADATGNADDVLTIHNPAPGTYEISLFGAHATANGEAYTLSVKQEATYEWLAIDDPPMEGEHTTPHEEGDTMRTMRRRIEARVNATMAQAAGTMAHGNRAINKAEAALDELLELLERLETDGLAIELVIAGRPFPVALRLAPAPEAPAPQATPTQDPPP